METEKDEKQRKGGGGQREGMVGVSLFIVAFLENSFRLCVWLIALLLAHEHTLYMQTHTFCLLYMAITMVTKCTEHNRGGIFLSFKGMETTIGMTKGGRNENPGERERERSYIKLSVSRWMCECVFVSVQGHSPEPSV